MSKNNDAYKKNTRCHSMLFGTAGDLNLDWNLFFCFVLTYFFIIILILLYIFSFHYEIIISMLLCQKSVFFRHTKCVQFWFISLDVIWWWSNSNERKLCDRGFILLVHTIIIFKFKFSWNRCWCHKCVHRPCCIKNQAIKKSERVSKEIRTSMKKYR